MENLKSYKFISNKNCCGTLQNNAGEGLKFSDIEEALRSTSINTQSVPCHECEHFNKAYSKNICGECLQWTNFAQHT